MLNSHECADSCVSLSLDKHALLCINKDYCKVCK